MTLDPLHTVRTLGIGAGAYLAVIVPAVLLAGRWLRRIARQQTRPPQTGAMPHTIYVLDDIGQVIACRHIQLDPEQAARVRSGKVWPTLVAAEGDDKAPDLAVAQSGYSDKDQSTHIPGELYGQADHCHAGRRHRRRARR